MDTHRGLVTSIVILSIAVLLLAIPRLGTTRLSYQNTGVSPFAASTADFYTTRTTTGAVPNLHFGGYSTFTNYIAPVSSTPTYYYRTTYTTTPQLPDESDYSGVLENDYYIGCTSYTGTSTVTGLPCAIRNY